MEKITVLGSTGSIGRSTLDVIRRNRDRFNVFALGACRNAERMLADVMEFGPEFAVLADEDAAGRLAQRLEAEGSATRVLAGSDGLCRIASSPECDSVMAAIVGAAGLVPALAAVKAGKKLYLANKESLVMTGHLFVQALAESGAAILPVDSEHNAIFQSLPETEQRRLCFCSMQEAGVDKILLTGSGGPFRTTDLRDLASVTPEQAVAHPTWNMGSKISVDSSTMMNKGFEFIEAKWLFNLKNDDIKVVIHPQSVIHSMVQYRDGSVLAQLGNPDMRTPIARVMSYPERIESGVGHLDFFSLKELTFFEPDYRRYPCLKLAVDACWSGQAATTALNAANEVAVAAFLDRRIAYPDICRICSQTVEKHCGDAIVDVDSVLELDRRARQTASALF
ncbi:MAG: 1-deoxy-D-xylulose-5-phosphate reductoisomerase [Succinivibrionaceae bacterium]|nr:1-deoxy-D-xylulose-5-phosphate reductoisomerase [Succinivibrionaceae bacterium]